MVTVSILGVGSRGGEVYGNYLFANKDKFKITNLCDIKPEKLAKYGERFNVPKENRFLSEDELLKEKRSDIVVISTLDKDHVREALKALDVGYDILLEKPISADENECKMLLEKAKKVNRKIMVCHVLRYTVVTKKLKEILDSGAIGKLIFVDQLEKVAYWHHSHSYVRGNWHNEAETSPMILAKCCHDLDLIQYFIGSKCDTVSSLGDLSYMKKENKPIGSADRCLDCKLKETCPYSAYNLYIKRWINAGKPENDWPFNVLSTEKTTEEVLMKALKEGIYGKCAFDCDNNVVDNQTVSMRFKNGVTATLRMMAFTSNSGRETRFFGSHGDVFFDEFNNTITVNPFGGKSTVYKVNELTDDLSGHGGGDNRMMDTLYDVMSGKTSNAGTMIEASIESHLIGIAAEKSRKSGGALIKL